VVGSAVSSGGGGGGAALVVGTGITVVESGTGATVTGSTVDSGVDVGVVEVDGERVE
jgi:hypothetical protein